MSNNQLKYDLIVIGGGPAGYVAAIRGAQLGAKVCLIEKGKLGGTCLNIGCIPTKALHKSAHIIKDLKKADTFGIKVNGYEIDFPKVMQNKAQVVKQLVDGVYYLIKKNNITHKVGTASFIDKNTVKVKGQDSEEQVIGEKILICTGSVNALPPIPGINSEGTLDSTSALELQQIPKSMLVIGGGVIGCEFASIYKAYGTDVTVVEVLKSLLAGLDEELGQTLQKAMQKDGIKLLLDSKVVEITDAPSGGKTVTVVSGGKTEKIAVEKVLVAAGRKPNVEGLELDKAGVKAERQGIVADKFMQTSVPNIYAAGDVIGRDMLAHVAYEEAVIAVENIMGAKRAMSYAVVPKAVFTFPEIASVGISEAEAKKNGLQVAIGKFSLRGNGKALTLGEAEGFIKIIASKEHNEILGWHMFGPQATELLAEATLAMSMEATLEDVEAAIHSHPSISEAVKEAVLDALGRVLHA